MIGRFAPTPSGRLHLGNLLCAMLAYLSARSQGGQFLLRIEDVDIPRCPRALAQQAIDDLRFLGFRWDAPPLYQSERSGGYLDVLNRLQAAGCDALGLGRKAIWSAWSMSDWRDSDFPARLQNLRWTLEVRSEPAA